jgi:hypothetical protein
MIAEYTRFFIYRSGTKRVLKNLWKAVKFCIRRVLKVFALYILWMIVPIALIVIFYIVRVNWSIDTGLMVLLLFLVQQIFIWIRILLRIQKTGIFYRYLLLTAP